MLASGKLPDLRLPFSTLKHEHQTTHTRTNLPGSAGRHCSARRHYRPPQTAEWLVIPWSFNLLSILNQTRTPTVAVRGVGSKIKRKLWIGTFSTPDTDSFKTQHRQGSVIRYDQLHWRLIVLSRSCGPLSTMPSQMPRRQSFRGSASWVQYQSVNQRFAGAIVTRQLSRRRCSASYHGVRPPVQCASACIPVVPECLNPSCTSWSRLNLSARGFFWLGLQPDLI